MIQNLENEIWKDIVGWEKYYQISNMGRIKALSKSWKCGHKQGSQIRTSKETIRKINYTGDGYGRVILIADKKRENWLIHRLVAFYFIPNTDNKAEVNHKWGDKKDNRVTELEWVTASENEKDAYKRGLKVALKGGDNPCAKIVMDTKTGIFYGSAKEAVRVTNYTRYQTLVDKLNGATVNNTSMIYV